MFAGRTIQHQVENTTPANIPEKTWTLEYKKEPNLADKTTVDTRIRDI